MRGALSAHQLGPANGARGAGSDDAPAAPQTSTTSASRTDSAIRRAAAALLGAGAAPRASSADATPSSRAHWREAALDMDQLPINKSSGSPSTRVDEPPEAALSSELAAASQDCREATSGVPADGGDQTAAPHHQETTLDNATAAAAPIDANDEVQPPQWTEIVHLSVGGRRLTTTLSTLRRDPRSRLARMFSGQEPITQMSDGTFFIDRDGRVFHHILNFLRDDCLPLGLSRIERLELLREAKYYEMSLFHTLIGGVQTPHGPSTMGGHCSHNAGGSSSTWRHHEAARIRSHLDEGAEVETSRERARVEAENMGFLPRLVSTKQFARLRWGCEYNGDWIVSSPRNLPGVEYELHGACLARGPIEAINLMSKAGWRPCDTPPKVPPLKEIYTNEWRFLMVREHPFSTTARPTSPTSTLQKSELRARAVSSGSSGLSSQMSRQASTCSGGIGAYPSASRYLGVAGHDINARISNQVHL